MKSISALLTILILASHATAQESSIPEKAHNALARFVGTWTHESNLNGSESGPGSGSRKWIADKSVVLMQGKIEGVGSVAGISGWNPHRQAIVETWHASNGTCLEVAYPLSAMGTARWLGTIKWGNADGTTADGLCSIEFNDQGWKWTAHWKQGGEEMTRENVAIRAQ